MIITSDQNIFLNTFNKLIMYESNTNTNTENKKAFQKWLAQIPENAYVDYQKQFREDPKKFKVVISFE